MVLAHYAGCWAYTEVNKADENLLSGSLRSSGGDKEATGKQNETIID